jgi:hypothetical protein
MAANKFKEGEKPKEKKKKLLPIENFYAHYAHYSFRYDIIDNDKDSDRYGKKVIVRDANNNPLYLPGGRLKVEQRQEVFNCESDKMSLGFLSVASFDPNTEDPQELERGRRLREISQRPDISMFDEDTHKKHTNFAAWEEAKKGAEKDELIKTLQERLAEAEGK